MTGATVHFVDEGTDTGPIILQKAVEVKEGRYAGDSSAQCHGRGRVEDCFQRPSIMIANGKIA